MPRRTKSLTIIEEFAPDPARCAQALLRLLLWEPSADAPETAQDVACGEAPQEEPADQEPPP
jgi:hypothetical protein